MSYYTCTKYVGSDGRIHCGNRADGRLLAPDGYCVGYYCHSCAEPVIKEYQEKLGETWTLEKVTS